MSRKVSPKRIFRSYHPNATIEKQRRNRNWDPSYFLVRHDAGAWAWTGCGGTPAKAWADACERSGYTTIKEPDTRTAIERSIDAEAERADVEYDRRVDDKITG